MEEPKSEGTSQEWNIIGELRGGEGQSHGRLGRERQGACVRLGANEEPVKEFKM